MLSLQEQLPQSREVAVWGLGYLGYTEIIRLQAKGIIPLVWDYQSERLQAFSDGLFPGSDHKAAWSMSGEIPSPDFLRLHVIDTPTELLRAPVHLFCIPTDIGWSVHTDVRRILLEHADALEGKLLIFLSVGVPGKIDSHYVTPLRHAKCNITVAFRQDWQFEEFLDEERPRVVAAKNASGLEAIRFFFSVLGNKTRSLPSIVAAEILANAENMLQALTGTYLNQLATAFPDTDVRKVSELLLDRYRPRLRRPSLGHLDMRQVSALQHLTATDATDAALSLAADVQRSSLSSLLSYADMLTSNGITSIAILGLAPVQAARRDMGFSSTHILSEYMYKKGVTVFVHDPAYTDAELRELIPFVRPFALEEPLPAEAALIMTDIPGLRRLNKEDLFRCGWDKARLIIDNLGILRHAGLSADTMYHIPGDGGLARLKG